MSITQYSDELKGDRGNFNWKVRFDLTGRYLGITQLEGDEVKDRVLLTPEQVNELVKFVGTTKPRRRGLSR